MVSTATATERFIAAILRDSLDIESVRAAVSAGALVTAEVESSREGHPDFFGYTSLPALSLLIRRGELEAVLACLESPAAIDFTQSYDRNATTPIHEIAQATTAGWPEYNKKVLQGVLCRVAAHPDDRVDWSREHRGKNGASFLSLAAEHHLLSVFWPDLRRHVEFYAHHREPIQLTGTVWATDWGALRPEEQQRFLKDDNSRNFVVASAETSRLWKMCSQYPAPDVVALCGLVKRGADITLPFGKYGSILCHSLKYGPMVVVEALLSAPHALDFTLEDESGYTPLRCITLGWSGTYCPKTTEEVRRLLHLVLDHLQRYPEEDKVDWGEGDRSGKHAPLSFAAASGHLSVVVDVLFHERPVPYFTQSREKIQISTTAWRSDVNRLRKEDLKRLDFVAGISESK